MSTTVEIGYDVRHWVTFGVKDATPEEIETLENDGEESIELASALWKAGRLVEISEHEEDNADYFDTASSSVIEVDTEADWEVAPVSAPDFWVDGHFIGGARDADDAKAEVLRLYGHQAETVRPWTAEDQAELDEVAP